MRGKLNRQRQAIKHITMRSHPNEPRKTINSNSKKQASKAQKLIPVELSTSMPAGKNSNSVWIIGGGPSLKDFDFDLLSGHDIIAVNKGICSVPRALAFITMDYTFVDYPKYKKCDFQEVENRADNKIFILNRSKPGRITHDDGVFKDSKFNYIYRDLYKFDHIYEAKAESNSKTGWGLNLESFAHGNNSGFCAVQLAILMGYQNIYLLGFDLKVQTWGNQTITHYHGGYGAAQFDNQLINSISDHLNGFKNASKLFKDQECSIYNCVQDGGLAYTLPYADPIPLLKKKKVTTEKTLDDLMVVGFYTKGTLYETEAQKTIASCKQFKLNHDIVGVQDFGGWQANTRYKAAFMREMLDKHRDKRLLYVDCDAIIRKSPDLFKDYGCDIAVRWQDFRWRKNECLSGTIYMENNEKTRELCDRWIKINSDDPDQVKNIEQWNLDKIITQMKPEGLSVKCLPPEYTFIFDHMKRIYRAAEPVIEHFQASRKARRQNP